MQSKSKFENEIVNFRQVGFVIPTLGLELKNLEFAIKSVQLNSCDIKIVVVSRKSEEVKVLCNKLGVTYIIENRSGLYAAINQGVDTIIDECKYFGFLGDDDSLNPLAVKNLLLKLEDNESVAVFGAISYVDTYGIFLMRNPGYKFAVKTIGWLPNLIPNIGALISINSWEKLGGYNVELKFASDLDFWIRLKKIGKISSIKYQIANFRFDKSTLTGGKSSDSLSEAASVRKSHTNGPLRIVKDAWEPLLRISGELIRDFKIRRERVK